MWMEQSGRPSQGWVCPEAQTVRLTEGQERRETPSGADSVHRTWRQVTESTASALSRDKGAALGAESV